MRVLNERGLDLPRRDRHGDLRWTRATVSAISSILKNPAYAGAFRLWADPNPSCCT